MSPPDSSNDDVSVSKAVGLLADPDRSPGSDSPSSGEASELEFPNKKEFSNPHNLDNYKDIRLIRDNRPSCAPSESQRRDPSKIPGFLVSKTSKFVKHLNL